MERTTTKKLLKGLFALSAGFLLASCDPVHALPKNHAESIVVNNDEGKTNIDVTDNDLLQIYNLIESGKNEEAVSQILREIAEKKFGTYKDLYDAVKDASKRDAFIAAHASYFGSDEKKGERFDDYVTDIDLRISESFYNEITSGSYNDEDGKFSEKKFYNAKRYELYDLSDKTTDVDNNKFYVDKEITKDNAFLPLKGTNNVLKGEYHILDGEKRGYIEEKVYPEILKNKFVESYIYDNNPSSLGRAYAREISYIKVSYDEKNESSALRTILKSFSKNYIEASANAMDFELITGAIKGFTKFEENKMVNNVIKDAAKDNTSDEYKVNKLLEAAYGSEKIEVENDYIYSNSIVLVPKGEYYKGTKLGKILASYEQAIKAEEAGRFAEKAQKEELDKFTGEGKSKEYGLMQKLISLAKEDYTTSGWVLKNGGATELPSAIRDRLFNIKVANILDDLKPEETIGSYDKKNYVRNINGNKLVLSSDAASIDKEHYNYIHEDTSGKAFYICEVKQAPSTAKLNPGSPTAYKADDGITVDTYLIEQLKRQVAKILGTKDSYIKDAYTDMLEDYEFKFYDTSLFEYLNSEYPDLELDD